MGVAHTVLLEVVAVVSARGHGTVVGQWDAFEALPRAVCGLRRHLDAHFPRFAVLGAAGRHLPANLDEYVFPVMLRYPVGHLIDRVSLRHGIEV